MRQKIEMLGEATSKFIFGHMDEAAEILEGLMEQVKRDKKYSDLETDVAQQLSRVYAEKGEKAKSLQYAH